jgi:predicted nucleic acid-binding protein
MEYLFDTNVILALVRETATRAWLNEHFQPFEKGNIAAVSIITLGELESIVLRNGWGYK